MSINAEALFNHLGERYEVAYGNSPNLDATVEAVLKLLPAGSTVLDVGSGTGKPVSHMLARSRPPRPWHRHLRAHARDCEAPGT
jgi:ubiquinone/menaquinone biosynthesis C-methylase UbiE